MSSATTGGTGPLPFAGDASTIHGYTVSQWHQIAMNASKTVAANPNDRTAHDALDYAHNAISAYASRLHNKAVAGDVADEQSLDPGPLAANASHALNSATFGLANQIGGPNWRAFQNLGDQFQPSASARGDIVGGAVTARPVGEAVARVAAPMLGPIASAIGAGFNPTAGAGEVVKSALGSGVALGAPSAVGGFFENPDQGTVGRLKDAGSAGLENFLLGATVGGLGAYATRGARLNALKRQASVAKAQATLATAPEAAARAPLQTALVGARVDQVPVRTELLQQRLEAAQQASPRPVQGQAGVSDAPVPVSDPREAGFRQALAKQGLSPTQIDERVAATKARYGGMPGSGSAAPAMGLGGRPSVEVAPPAPPTASVPQAAPAGAQSAGRPVVRGMGAALVAGNPDAMWRELLQYPLTPEIQNEMGPALQGMNRQNARAMMAHVAQADAFGSISAPWRDFLLTHLQKAGSAR